MTKLHQVIPAVDEVAKTAQNRLTEIHKLLSKEALTSGHHRSYQPDNDEGDVLPDQGQLVQLRVDEAIAAVRGDLVSWIDIAATRDIGNTDAKADIVIDGVVIAADVPATTLLWLEKRADDLYKFVSGFPTLPTDEQWAYNVDDQIWRSAPTETVRTSKVAEVITLAAATDHHPAQTQLVQVDRREGVWTTVKLSGAIPQSSVRAMIDRVSKLRVAVKAARARANEVEVAQARIGDRIIGFVFDETV